MLSWYSRGLTPCWEMVYLHLQVCGVHPPHLGLHGHAGSTTLPRCGSGVRLKRKLVVTFSLREAWDSSTVTIQGRKCSGTCSGTASTQDRRNIPGSFFYVGLRSTCYNPTAERASIKILPIWHWRPELNWCNDIKLRKTNLSQLSDN